MRYRILDVFSDSGSRRHVNIDRGAGEFTSFPAEIDNPNYGGFLESQGLRDAEVQAMEPDVWHDMAASSI